MIFKESPEESGAFEKTRAMLGSHAISFKRCSKAPRIAASPPTSPRALTAGPEGPSCCAQAFCAHPQMKGPPIAPLSVTDYRL